MVDDVNQTRSLYHLEWIEWRVPGWDSKFTRLPGMGKNLIFNWWELILMAMKCKWKRFPYPKHLSKNICEIFVHHLYFTFFQPQCVFLFFFSSLLLHSHSFFFRLFQVVLRNVKLSCVPWWLSNTMRVGDDCWMDHPTCCEERWCMNMVLTQNRGKRSCWITPKSLQTSGIFMKHCFLGDAKWFWLHKKLSSETNIR